MQAHLLLNYTNINMNPDVHHITKLCGLASKLILVFQELAFFWMTIYETGDTLLIVYIYSCVDYLSLIFKALLKLTLALPTKKSQSAGANPPVDTKLLLWCGSTFMHILYAHATLINDI